MPVRSTDFDTAKNNLRQMPDVKGDLEISFSMLSCGTRSALMEQMPMLTPESPGPNDAHSSGQVVWLDDDSFDKLFPKTTINHLLSEVERHKGGAGAPGVRVRGQDDVPERGETLSDGLRMGVP